MHHASTASASEARSPRASVPSLRRRLGVAFLGLAALGLFSTPAQAQKKCENERYGFTLMIPKDYREVPINPDESYVVAKFLYKRRMTGRNDYYYMTPEIRVIVFPKVDLKDLARRRAKERIAKKSKSAYFDFDNPYKNYTEYLRDNYSKGSFSGWHVAKEKKTKVGKLPAVFKKIAIKALGAEEPTRYIFAWEIDMGDATYVLTSEAVADFEDKFGKLSKGALRKFRKTDKYGRQEAITGTATSSSSKITRKGRNKKEKEAIRTEAELAKLSPEERRDYWMQRLEETKERAKEAMPSGWKSMESKPFLILYNADARFAKMVAKQAQLVWKHMGKNYGYIGSDYAIPCVIRVCKDRVTASAYLDTSAKSSYNYSRKEIVTYKSKDWLWNEDAGFYFNQGIARQFLYHKNPQLWWALPPWLDYGLTFHLSFLRMKSGKLESKPDEWSMDIIRTNLRDDSFKPAKTLIAARWKQWGRSTKSNVQTLAMVHFLTGSKSKSYKNIVADYIGVLDKKLRDLKKANADAIQEAVSKAGDSKDEDEDEEILRRWQLEWKKRSNKVYEECQDRVFGSWTEKDWERFDRDWKKTFKR